MKADDPEFLALVAAISDGADVNWDVEAAADAASGSGDRRAMIRSLRIVARVAALHRSLPDAPAPPSHATNLPLPHAIGRFRIVRLIAEGGMGAVYEAEQERPRRTVALKVIRPGYATGSMLRRFELESQVLARLQHPGIAQIYEAGAADFGVGSQPFFAMEMVYGEPLMRHAEERLLDARARIELLARVADAVEHAHQKGVIHRDLKPANILVDESGQPKVLDFGVARATDSDVQATTRTDIGQLVGTLPYMSPEQIAGDPAQLDTRSDVYALGVLLYELLTRRLPYELSGKPLPEVAHIIREQEPVRPGSIDRTLRGDLETIVTKALEKDKERRYQSAAGLAQDLRRYLRREPIAARPSTTLYQIRKFARRHPELVGGLAAVFLALAAGVVGTSVGLIRATRQRDLANAQRALAEASRKVAERETQRALQVKSFMQDLLASARPGAMGTGRDIKVADILDQAAINLAGPFANEPELEMEARSTLGQTYSSLGLYDEAVRNLERAFELARVHLPEQDEARLTIADRLAWALASSGQAYQRSEELAGAALPVARRALGQTHPCTLSLMNTLSFAMVLQWKLQEAEPILNELLPALRAVPPARRGFSPSAVMVRLARIRSYAGHDLQGGDALARESLAAAKEEGVSAWEDAAQHITEMAAEILIERSPDEAEQLYRKALANARRTLGRQHPQALRIGIDLAQILSTKDEPAEALELYREMLTYARAHAWRQAPWKESSDRDRVWLLATVAGLAARAHRNDEAAAAWAEAISCVRRSKGDSDPFGQKMWSDWTIRLGLGIQERWVSEALRTQVRRIVIDNLDSHPTRTFEPDEVQWDQLRFRLSRWSGKAEPRSAAVAGRDTLEGGIDLLKSLPGPEPGLYRLALEAPRRGGAPFEEAGWMLVSPWDLALYSARFARVPEPERRGEIEATRGHEDEAWRARLASEPDERRTEPALSLQGWWDTGFGPKHRDYSFGIVARTTIALPAGAYRFLVTANDGARLWIDERLQIDAWTIRPTTTDAAVVQLSEGPHKIRVDYFQHAGASQLWVRAEPLDDRSGGTRTLPLGGNP